MSSSGSYRISHKMPYHAAHIVRARQLASFIQASVIQRIKDHTFEDKMSILITI